MKKLISLLLVLTLALVCCVVHAEIPVCCGAKAETLAKGSLNAVAEVVRRNSSFTAESWPEIWISPIFDDHIIGQTDPEKYPAKFLHFAPLPDTAPMDFSYDQATFVNHEKMQLLGYYAYDRYAFELFLEKAEEQNTIADGSDGVAMFVQPDSGRARALIDLKPQFGGTAKLEIVISDYNDATADELKQMIQAEAERVQGAMRLEETGHYWSDGVFQSVKLVSNNERATAMIDTSALTVAKLDPNRLVSKVFVKQGQVASTEISLDSYSYALSKFEEKDPAASEEALADGTAYTSYTSEYTGYAAFPLLGEGGHGPLYLTVRIDCGPEAFKEKLEAVYKLITLQVEAE